ncbi:MAG: Hint domain-containing protein [Pseudomonadota bacterium]
MSTVTAFANDANGDGVIWEDDLGGAETITVDGVTSGLDSIQSYNAIVSLGDGSTFTTTLGVAQLSNGEAYIVPYHETQLDNLNIQSIELTSILIDDYDGMYVTSAERSVDNSSIVCFAAGARIATPEGARPVEVLKPGDPVMTRDHGPQIVRWTRSSDHALGDVEDEAKPVQVSAGALGRGLPTTDLVVSPQHRILVGGAGQLDGLFTREAFAPAKFLTALPGIRHMRGKKEITWFHFACDRHEIVTANGCHLESLLLGPMVLNGLNAAERRAVVDQFGMAPVPGAALNGPPARVCLKASECRRAIVEYRQSKGRRGAKAFRNWTRGDATEMHRAAQTVETSWARPRNPAQ